MDWLDTATIIPWMVEWLALKYLATYSPSFGGVYIAGHDVLKDPMPPTVGRSPDSSVGSV